MLDKEIEYISAADPIKMIFSHKEYSDMPGMFCFVFCFSLLVAI